LRRSQAQPLELAVLLNSYARTERLKGKFETASGAAREGLELRGARVPQSLLVAASATELGLAREGAGAYDEAGTLYREALGIREKLAPNSTDVAESLERAAVVPAATGDPLAARNAFERAVDAWQRVSANSLDHANVIHELGNFLIARGDADEGLRRLREAVAMIEANRAARPTGTTEARSQLV